jgi:hypothetical protein
MATGQRAAGRRAYGTGSLQLVGGSWVGLWRAPDGLRIKRTIGRARTPGERDGLTKVQAEEAFRRLRAEEVALAHRVERVTMLEAGEALSARLAVRGRKKSHRLTVGSDLRNHIVPFFAGKELSRITARDIERYIAVKQRSLATKTVRNHLGTMHSVFELGCAVAGAVPTRSRSLTGPSSDAPRRVSAFSTRRSSLRSSPLRTPTTPGAESSQRSTSRRR